MPRIEKKTMKDVKMDRATSRQKMYTSAILSYIIAVILLIVSLLINAEFIHFNFGDSVGLNLLEDIVRAGIIILFFFFLLISAGNYFELKGQVMELPHLIIISVIALILAIKDGSAFILSFLGVIGILIYFYLLQPKVK
jgi:hypothetical protein